MSDTAGNSEEREEKWMALIDVVRFDGLKSRDWLIYKYPSEDLCPWNTAHCSGRTGGYCVVSVETKLVY